jgi:hypothetical protein
VATFLCGTSLLAQDATFVAVVDRNPVGVGEQFTLSFVLTSATMGGGKNLQLPDLSRFHIMAGPNQSSSMQIINGAVSSTVSYEYVLQPKDVGKYEIGPGAIEVGGKVYRSEKLIVEVVKTATRPKPQAAQQVDPQVQIGDNLFLKATVDRARVTQGEQINLEFKIYTRVAILRPELVKNPTLTGFWGEDVDVPQNTSPRETYNGKQYQVGVVKKMALFPTQSGTLEIGPMELKVGVQIQNRSSDPFDSFFRDPFGRTVSASVKSEPLKITVDPLPAGAPAEFRGAVGRFGMSSSIDKKTTRTNEPVSIKVTISGTGNIKLLEAPSVEFPPDFEQYPPKVTESITKGEKISGSKSFEFLVMPRYPGMKTISPLTFVYYDPSKREYVRLRSPQMELHVEQGAATQGPIVAGGAREDVRLLSQDIRFIKVGTPSFTRTGEYLHTSPVFIVLLILPLAGLGGALAFAGRRRAVLADEAGYRHRQAMKLARKGLKVAEYLLNLKGGAQDGPVANQRLRFYSEVSKALWKYLGDKLSMAPAGLSVETASAELQRRGVEKGLLSAFKALVETCDMARFAPSSLEVPRMQRTYEEARRVIVELERVLK